MVPEPESVSFSIDRKGVGKPLESDQMPIRKDVTASMRVFVGHKDAIEYSRVEVLEREGDQILRVSTSRMEPHVERLKSLLNRTSRLDGVVDVKMVETFLDFGSGITFISDWVQRRSLKGRSRAWNLLVLPWCRQGSGQRSAAKIPSPLRLLFALTMDTDRGQVQFKVSFIVLPGEERLIT